MPTPQQRMRLYTPPAPAAAAAGNGLLNNLVAYWGLDEAGGANNALDKHSHGLTVAQVASPGSNTGKVYVGARTFDGSTQYFSRADDIYTSTGDVDFTIAAWVYLSGVTTNQIIVAKTGSTFEYALLYVRDDSSPNNRFGFYVSSNGSTLTTHQANTFGAASANTWYLVIAHHDAANNQIGICVNAGTPDTVSYSTGVYDGAGSFNIGAALYPTILYQLAGRIGPVMMWKSAPGGGGVLTADQRTALYNAGAGLAYASFTT